MSITPKQAVNKTSIGYLDFINSSATDISTAYHILENCLMIKQARKMETIVCVFDQAYIARQ